MASKKPTPKKAAKADTKPPVKKVAVKVVKKEKPNQRAKSLPTVKDVMDKLHETDAPFMSGLQKSADMPVLSPDAHAEAIFAAEDENKEFGVSEPIVTDAKLITALAWNEIKDASDPPFHACVQTHQQKFISHAESILNGNSPMQGDSSLARFEQRVARMVREK